MTIHDEQAYFERAKTLFQSLSLGNSTTERDQDVARAAEAAAMFQELSALNFGKYGFDWAIATNNHAYTLTRVNEMEGALKVSQKAVEIARELVNQFGSKQQQRLVLCLSTLSQIENQLEHHEAALAHAKECTSLRAQLSEPRPHLSGVPTLAATQVAYAEMAEDMAKRQLAIGNLESALNYNRESAQTYRLASSSEEAEEGYYRLLLNRLGIAFALFKAKKLGSLGPEIISAADACVQWFGTRFEQGRKNNLALYVTALRNSGLVICAIKRDVAGVEQIARAIALQLLHSPGDPSSRNGTLEDLSAVFRGVASAMDLPDSKISEVIDAAIRHLSDGDRVHTTVDLFDQIAKVVDHRAENLLDKLTNAQLKGQAFRLAAQLREFDVKWERSIIDYLLQTGDNGHKMGQMVDKLHADLIDEFKGGLRQEVARVEREFLLRIEKTRGMFSWKKVPQLGEVKAGPDAGKQVADYLERLAQILRD